MTLLLALLLAQATQHPCLDDAKKLCPGVEPGQGRVAACLKEHKAQLSQACKSRIAEFREGALACQADAQKLCPGTKPGAERRQCMEEHKDQVSPECRELFSRVAEPHGAVGEAVRACRADVKTFCKDVKPGEGRIAECLKQHKGELSPDCAARLP
jgi:Golgi apparatus protein 1